jgi:hypothetical protein
MPKCLADKNIPRLVVKRLQEAGYDIKPVSEVEYLYSPGLLSAKPDHHPNALGAPYTSPVKLVSGVVVA